MVQSVQPTAACYSLQIGRCQVLNRGLHLDHYKKLQWSKLVKIGVHKMRNKKLNPQLNVSTSLADSYSASQELHPAEWRNAPDGVCKGVGCARQQSKTVTRCFRELEVASQQRKILTKSQKYFISRAVAYSFVRLTTSPMKMRISPNVYCSPGGGFEMFRGRNRNTRRRENCVPVRRRMLGPKKGFLPVCSICF